MKPDQVNVLCVCIYIYIIILIRIINLSLGWCNYSQNNGDPYFFSCQSLDRTVQNSPLTATEIRVFVWQHKLLA